MSANNPIGEVTVHRFLERNHHLGLAMGTFSALFKAYQDHVERWELYIDGLSFTMIREAIAAGALHLVTRPNDESFGLTLNVNTPPLNIFIAGDAEISSITGRVFVDGVKTEHNNRFFMEAHRRTGEPLRSVIEVQGLDVLGMFEDYYRDSEQNPARFFEMDPERYLMIYALPDADPALIAGLDREKAAALFTQPLQALEERTVRFRCGCNPDRMLGVLKSLFTDQPDELFQGEDDVETFCPRCGARWKISREDFSREAADETP